MMMTMLPSHNKSQTSIRHRVQTKIGISVVSSNLSKINNRTHRICGKNKQNIEQKNSKAGTVVLKSLSIERNYRKKLKMKENLMKNEKDQRKMNRNGSRQQMMVQINQLQAQLDQLKLKRSYITQRDSQISTKKPQLSNFDYHSDIKHNHPITSQMLLSKCIPKSKINLSDATKSNKILRCSYQYNESNSLTGEKSRMTYHESRLKYFRQRLSNNSQSTCRIEDTNQSMGSLSNIQVIPLGLNLTLSKRNRLTLQQNSKKNYGENVSRHLFGESQKKKGIKVISRQKSLSSSLSNSSVSLYVSKQIQRQKKQLTYSESKQIKNDVEGMKKYAQKSDYLHKSSQTNLF